MNKRHNGAPNRAYKLRFLPLLILVWIVVLLCAGDVSSIRQWLMQPDNLLFVAGVTIFLIMLSAMVPLPGEVLATANGMVFGFVLGSVITWMAALSGAYLTFLLAHKLKMEFTVPGSSGTGKERVDQWITRWGVTGFFIARLMPTVPFFSMNILAAYLPVSRSTFLFATSLALIPHAVAFNYVGAKLVFP